MIIPIQTYNRKCTRKKFNVDPCYTHTVPRKQQRTSKNTFQTLPFSVIWWEKFKTILFSVKCNNWSVKPFPCWWKFNRQSQDNFAFQTLKNYSMNVLFSRKLSAKRADFLITAIIAFLLLFPKMQKELSNLFKKKIW